MKNDFKHFACYFGSSVDILVGDVKKFTFGCPTCKANFEVTLTLVLCQCILMPYFAN